MRFQYFSLEFSKLQYFTVPRRFHFLLGATDNNDNNNDNIRKQIRRAQKRRACTRKKIKEKRVETKRGNMCRITNKITRLTVIKHGRGGRKSESDILFLCGILLFSKRNNVFLCFPFNEICVWTRTFRRRLVSTIMWKNKQRLSIKINPLIIKRYWRKSVRFWKNC